MKSGSRGAHTSRGYLVVGIFGTVAAAAPAFGQAGQVAGTAVAAEDTAAASDIVVTATKRAARLLDVPVAVTALTGDALSNQQVQGVDSLQKLVPSLTFQQSTNDLNNNLRIRGVGTALFNVGLESSVSVVVDGVVLSRQGQGFQDLIDIDRVEVLRGPQGILFGKNATAGLINVVTKRPSDHWTYDAEGVIAEQNEYRLRGSVSGPLGPGLGLRVTGFWNDVGGHIQNVATDQDYNGGKSYGVRAKLEYEPTDTLDFLVIGDYRKSDALCCQFQARSFANPVALAALLPIVPSPTNTQVANDEATFNNTRQWGASLEGNWKIGGHTFTSISAYRTWDFANNIDVDGLNNSRPLALLPLVASGIGQFNINGGQANIRQFTQEVRLTSPAGGLFEYVLGVYYFNLSLDRAFQRRVFLCLPGGVNSVLVPGQPCAVPQPASTFHNANTGTENIAGFGQLTLNLTSSLALLGGFRLQHETVSYVGNRPGTPLIPGDIALNPASAGSGSVGDTNLSLRGGVEYKFSRNAQAYATYTEGYKGRGYDVEITANFASQVPVKPETVRSYEIGFKGATADRRLSANIALFYEDFTNLQVQASTVVNGLTSFIQTNAGSSVSKGLEIEFQVRPSRSLTLSGGFTYLNAKINTTGTNCSLAQTAVVLATGTIVPGNTCYRLTGEAASANRQNIANGDLPNAPSYRLNLSARYERPLFRDLDLFVQPSINLQSDVLFSLDQDPATRQDGYPTVDTSIGLSQHDGRYQLTFFVKNLFDQHFTTSIFRDSFFGGAASPANLSQYVPKDANRYVGASLQVHL